MQPNVETLNSLQLYYAQALQRSCLNAELRQNFEGRMIEIAEAIAKLGSQTRQGARDHGSGGGGGDVVSSDATGAEPAVKTRLGCAHCGHDDYTLLSCGYNNATITAICAKCRLPWKEKEYRTACGHKVEDCTCEDQYEVAEERYRKFCTGSSRAWRSLGTEGGEHMIGLGIKVDGVEMSDEFIGYVVAAVQEKWTYLLADAERIARRALEAAREERRLHG